ncbi:hypothetical protein [Aquabacterium sp. CECT 9606]|uniref:hypothetical protein n=1 Tax=Aquabacterium sp. CECT 9606 TaxID=2845822 RepID=UPI001E507AF9|nr:hypothetical protein [Aquabacterium sp. CECT 9606]CAH0354744.1 Fumarate hydratase class II [Aquabacterium sp. CECT 9606]
MPSRTEQHAMHTEPMPSELIAAMAMVKRACAKASRDLAQTYPGTAQAIDMATSQITSDPRAGLHLAASVGVVQNLLPALVALSAELENSAQLQSASKSRKLSRHAAQLRSSHEAIMAALPCAHQLVMNQGTSPQVREQLAKALTCSLSLPFLGSADATLTPEDALGKLAGLHRALTSAAMALSHVGETVRELAPARQDTMQCDALAMVCRQVTDNDQALGEQANAGQLAHKLLQSIRLLTDATTVFTDYVVHGLTANRDRHALGLASSLMLATSNSLQTV